MKSAAQAAETIELTESVAECIVSLKSECYLPLVSPEEATVRLNPFLMALLILMPVSVSSEVPTGAANHIQSPLPSSYCRLLHLPTAPRSEETPKPYLGITYTSQKLEKPLPPCTESFFIRVESVLDGSPAAEAGIRENDILLSYAGNPSCLGGKEILAPFRKMIEAQKIGATFPMEILRHSEKVSVTAKLAKAPTRYYPEADHRAVETCPEQPSLLETALRSQGALPLWNRIMEGLYRRSNTLINPGSSLAANVDQLRLQEVTWMLRHPLSAGTVAKELSRQLTAYLHENEWRPVEMVRQAAHLLDLDTALLNPPREITFPELLRVMGEAKARVERVLSRLTPEETALLREKSLSPWEDTRWNGIVDASLKVDRGELFSAFLPLLSFLTRDNLAVLREDLLRRFGNASGALLYEASTPMGKVIVGGTGPNIYRDDVALVLDLGGDDLYLNNAGGTRTDIPVALVIDWEGDDRYIARDNISQGAGVLGGGFLLDLGGNDLFVAQDGDQGAGLWGIGLLYHGDGSATYRARSFAQGVGQMGIGLMVNRGGDSLYHSLYGGQGLGLFGGAGILIDEGGNDTYQLGGLQPDFRDPAKSTVSLGQGFGEGKRAEKGKAGVPGGVGGLIDEAGDDTYIADYFAQGSSYFYGLGILNDRGGNDRYIAGRYAQGAGVHSSVGVLMDEKGNDSFFASFGVAQGLGHDHGVGFFEDDEGDDTYWGGQLVQGAATNGSVGILIDLKGNDRYTCSGKGQAYADEEDGMGIMMDTEPSQDSLSSHKNVAPVRVGVTNQRK